VREMRAGRAIEIQEGRETDERGGAEEKAPEAELEALKRCGTATNSESVAPALYEVRLRETKKGVWQTQ
jgi:hypothetical protein